MALLNTTLTATASQHAKSSQRLQLGLSSQPRGIELELLTSTQSESLRSALSTNFQDKLKKGQQEHQFDSVRPTNNTQLTNMYDKSSTDMFRGFQFGSNKATKMEWEESEKKPKTSHQKKHKHCLIVYCWLWYVIIVRVSFLKRTAGPATQCTSSNKGHRAPLQFLLEETLVLQCV